MISFLVSILSVVLFAVPAAADSGTQDTLDGFSQSEALDMITGEYDGPVNLRIGEIDAHNFGYWTTYAEFRMGGPTAPVSRQRIFTQGWGSDIENGEVVRHTPLMQAFDFPMDRRAAYVGGVDDPQLFEGAVRADFLSFPFGCTLQGKREGDVITYAVRAGECIIDNPQEGKRQVELTFTFSPEGMTIYEVGYDLDGNKLFGTDEPIFLKRIGD